MKKMTTDEFNLTPQEVIEQSSVEMDSLTARNIMRCKSANKRKQLMKFAEEVGAVKFVLDDVQKGIVEEYWEIQTRQALEGELHELSELSEGSGDLMADMADALHRQSGDSRIENRIVEINQMLASGDFSAEMAKHPVEYTLASLYTAC